MRRAWTLVVLAAAFAAGVGPANSQEDYTPLPAGVDDIRILMTDRLYELNDEYWHRGEFGRCIETLLVITQIDPRDTEAYDSAAWLLQNEFRDDESEAVLREGLLWNPDTYDLYFDLGYFLYMHERYEEAVELLETAVILDAPLFVRHVLAHAHELAGRPWEALIIWLMVEPLEPDSNVPELQIERILRGGAPTNVPARMQRWRAERMAREGKH